MFKEKILKLYNLKIIATSLIARLVLALPLIVTLKSVISDQKVYSETLETFALHINEFHLLVFIMSLIVVPLLACLLFKYNFKNIFLRNSIYFILYYMMINMFLVFIEAHYMAEYKIGS